VSIPVLLTAAVTDIGKVRTGNEDSHWVDNEAGIAIVCDGMGGHAAGEVASALAVQRVRERWTGAEVTGARDVWLRTGTPQARRTLFALLRAAVFDANQAIIDSSKSERDKHGMGTTFTGAMFVGGEAMIAHAGDSRAYLVRDGVAMRITEDHTLLARLAEAGVDLGGGGEATRWKGVVTNALGIGEPTWIATFAVPLADGDRLLLCSDGVSEYYKEEEIGEVLTKTPSPSKAAQKLVDGALERGGHDNATAVVIKVVEAGTGARSPAARKKAEQALLKCPLFAELSPQRQLRVLRVATEHQILDGESLPTRFLGDRVAWIILEGRTHRGNEYGKPGSLHYPEALVSEDDAGPDWHARGLVRALALRADDVAELATEEPDVGEKLYGALATHAGMKRRARRQTGETGEF
jgi:serine/threonine protein phosphatase PrpC